MRDVLTNIDGEVKLIERATAGDLDAFNQLVLRYQDIAYSQAYTLLRDPDQAEDAAQESFLRAFQAMNGFRGGSFRAWLLKIVTNSTYDLLRRSQRHPAQSLFLHDENGKKVESLTWLVDPASDVQGILEQCELSQQIYQALDELPEVFRSVLTLIDVNEMDYVEAAKVLNIPLGTVKSRLARARLQMQEKLRSNTKEQNPPITNESYLAV